MSSTFVSIHDHGFWMNDRFLELILRLLALHIPEPDADTSSQREVTTKTVRDRWLLASQYHFAGSVPIDLDAATSTEEGKVIVRTALRSLLRALSSGPRTYDASIYHILGLSDPSRRGDVEADLLIEGCQAFLDLLDGKITWTASDDKYVPSFRSSAARADSR